MPDESWIRRIVVEEINTRLGPMGAKVDRLDRTLRSLYSNGSGGPPGYLETARKEDDERYQRLFDMVDAIRKQREKVWNTVLHLGWKIVVGIFAAFLAVAGWVWHASQPFLKIIWEDVLKEHPTAQQKIKNLSYTPDPVLSSNHKPQQDASALPY